MSPFPAGVVIRPVAQDEDLVALTAMIHAAYAPHAARGLRFWGTHQSVADTARRLASGRAWVVCNGDRYVGTATLRPPQPDSAVPLYRQAGIYTLSQFCVCPTLKGTGLGKALHAHVLAEAEALGALGLALDTAQPASGLIALYEAWGYTVVGRCDWRPDTNYESVVMYQPVRLHAAPSRSGCRLT